MVLQNTINWIYINDLNRDLNQRKNIKG